jgi:hypothetical protein
MSTDGCPVEERYEVVETESGRLVLRRYSNGSLRVMTQVAVGQSWLTCGALDLDLEQQLALAHRLCGAVTEIDMGAA